MNREAPAWLAEFQKHFGSVIRTPLERASGTLSATPLLYDTRITDDVRDAANANRAARLAVYNRQYWFRLFNVLQSAFPLTARLLGFWDFNDYAARFLGANAPRGWDLDDASEGFEAFFADALVSEITAEKTSNRALALTEAARIDAAWLRIFRAPKSASYRPSADEAAHLLDAQLAPSPALAIIEEHFPLLDLRKKILVDSSDARVALPAPLARPRHWALMRTDQGTLQFALETREAELLNLLRSLSVREALAQLEQNCDAGARAQLPEKTRVWLARSVQRDFWSGVT